ncbi:hypothetical protein HYDPIDRAFT_119809 [Hydnomerulius pinastri MD-312]|uniref:Uncharacterized protein n=1 Tax=Hydnomerulius pinastri MD-312 TaxID=994086 RepID=A0A0C9W6A6_9AGAM|nr:hypothetical protein HYDPIDRAFT_119809 [Hydnomerulius pinastri MD-312]
MDEHKASAHDSDGKLHKNSEIRAEKWAGWECHAEQQAEGTNEGCENPNARRGAGSKNEHKRPEGREE